MVYTFLIPYKYLHQFSKTILNKPWWNVNYVTYTIVVLRRRFVTFNKTHDYNRNWVYHYVSYLRNIGSMGTLFIFSGNASNYIVKIGFW